MAISLYSKPAPYTYRPIDMGPLLQLKQMEYATELQMSERRRKESLEAEASLMVQDSLLGQIKGFKPKDVQRADEIKSGYKDIVKKQVDKISESGGSFADMLPYVKAMNSSIVQNVQSGELSQISGRYSQATKALETFAGRTAKNELYGAYAEDFLSQVGESIIPPSTPSAIDLVQDVAKTTGVMRGESKQAKINAVFEYLATNPAYRDHLRIQSKALGVSSTKYAEQIAKEVVEFKFRQERDSAGAGTGITNLAASQSVSFAELIQPSEHSDFWKFPIGYFADTDLSKTHLFKDGKVIGGPKGGAAYVDNQARSDVLDRADKNPGFGSVIFFQYDARNINEKTTEMTARWGDMEKIALNTDKKLMDIDLEDIKNKFVVTGFMPGEHNLLGVTFYYAKIQDKGKEHTFLMLDNSLKTPRERMANDVFKVMKDGRYRVEGKTSGGGNGEVDLHNYYPKVFKKGDALLKPDPTLNAEEGKEGWIWNMELIEKDKTTVFDLEQYNNFLNELYKDYGNQ